MESLIAFGLVSVVGIAVYLIRRKPSDKPKLKRNDERERILALSNLDEDIKNHPLRLPKNRQAFAYFYQGAKQLQNQDYNAAIEWYSKGIEEDPNCTSFYNDRGVAYLQKLQFELAIADLNRAIELDPMDWRSYSNRAVVFNNKFQYREAISSATRAIELSANILNPYIARGFAYIRVAEYEKALQDFEHVTRFAPDDESSHSFYAEMLMKTGNYDKSFSVLNKLIETSKNRVNPLNTRAWYKAYIGDYEASLEDIETAIKLSKKISSSLVDTRGQTKWLLGDYQDALDDFTMADELEHRENTINNMFKAPKAVALFSLGLKEDAIQLWKQVTDEANAFQSAESYQNLFMFAPPFYEAMQELEKLADAS